MRQGQNPKRLRGRGNGRKHPPRNQNFESNGPDVKVRGNAQQVVERYLALARDTSLAGDRITAEAYFQHAEHYYRIMVANGAVANNREQNAQGENGAAQGEEQPNLQAQPDTPARQDPVPDSDQSNEDSGSGPAEGEDSGAEPLPV